MTIIRQNKGLISERFLELTKRNLYIYNVCVITTFNVHYMDLGCNNIKYDKIKLYVIFEYKHTHKLKIFALLIKTALALETQ